jgi:hypothetical protein
LATKCSLQVPLHPMRLQLNMLQGNDRIVLLNALLESEVTKLPIRS